MARYNCHDIIQSAVCSVGFGCVGPQLRFGKQLCDEVLNDGISVPSCCTLVGIVPCLDDAQVFAEVVESVEMGLHSEHRGSWT